MADPTLGSSPGETTVNGKGEAAATNPDYIAFVLVPVFFLLGLLGVVICHVLKRKGYRCTTESQDGDEDVFEEEKDPELGVELNDTMSENNDTVGQIVHYIMKNQANSEALKAMINENSFDSDGRARRLCGSTLGTLLTVYKVRFIKSDERRHYPTALFNN
ncbi:hypothetical protein F2P81_018382 [Scophthalmus maximus]|uniref:RELT-like protein 1 n=1 Tax=Scophthalmus maximus TaxID=52904 RepID=A0A6A4S833_SCOMX|nr:hypothetical protein F2P81_018382 [Scophthalmus maximus]